jgi:hypothetical protein
MLHSLAGSGIRDREKPSHIETRSILFQQEAEHLIICIALARIEKMMMMMMMMLAWPNHFELLLIIINNNNNNTISGPKKLHLYKTGVLK